jgi:hypothetical protein
MTLKSVRWNWVIAVVVVTGVGGIASADLGHAACIRPQSLELPCPAQKQVLVSHAVSFAALNGESHPTSGLLVATTRRAFNGLFGSKEINSDVKVYVVVLHGNFVGHMASRPYRAKAPVGRVLAVVYDVTSNEVSGWTLARSLPGITRLGPSEPIE